MKTDLRSITSLCRRVTRELEATAVVIRGLPDEVGCRLAEEWAEGVMEDFTLYAAEFAKLTRALRVRRVKRTEELERKLSTERLMIVDPASSGATKSKKGGGA